LREDLGLLLDDHLDECTGGVFVGDEVLLDVSFEAARARLADLAYGGSLVSASREAYGEGITALSRVGPLGSAPGVFRLVEVHVRELVTRDESAVLALRWEATGPDGGVFPALDADITLTPAGDRSTLLTLAAVYRPPSGALGAGPDRVILHRVAAAAIQTLVSCVAYAVAHPAGAAGAGRGNAGPEGAWRPPEPETS
jgi:hypothetical protein